MKSHKIRAHFQGGVALRTLSIGLLQIVSLTVFAHQCSAESVKSIRYAELATQLAPYGKTLKGHTFTAITRDGRRHSGIRMTIYPDRLDLCPRGKGCSAVDAKFVEAVEIRRYRSLIRRNLHIAALPFTYLSSPLTPQPGFSASTVFAADCLLLAAMSPYIAFAVVTAPISIAADGIDLSLPKRVYRIVP